MADHVLSSRTPDQILKDIDEAFSVRSLDLEISYGRDLVWDVINSVRDSYALALRAEYEITMHDESWNQGTTFVKPMKVFPSLVAEIEATVDDYLTNNWGND